LLAVILLAWSYLLLGAGIEMEQMDMGGGQMMLVAPAWTASRTDCAGMESTVEGGQARLLAFPIGWTERLDGLPVVSRPGW
jgi:hypothetical protein